MTDATAVEERPLAASEAAFVSFGTPIHFSQRLYGRLDLDALASAVEDLLVLHPVLSARIVASDQGHVLRLDPSVPGPRLGVADGGDEAGSPYAPDTPLFRVVVTEEAEDRHRLALSVHHAISDGVSALTLLHTLWRSYSARVAGRAPVLPPRTAGLPRPVEEHFRARFSAEELHDFLRNRSAKIRDLVPACIPACAAGRSTGAQAGVHRRRVPLSAGSVDQLTCAAKAARMSLHALACGIALCAVHSQTPFPDGTVPMTCLSALDLRRRFRPPMSMHEMVLAATASQAVVEVGPDCHPLGIGRRVLEQLREAVLNNTVQKAIAATAELMDEVAHAPISVLVSDLTTKTPPLQLPPDLSSGPIDGCALPPGPLPSVFLTGSQDDTAGLDITLVMAADWFTARQADDLAEAIEGAVHRALRE
ncbi:condensation domain-containing protein [Streptomyces sp. SCA3-4]|uniref:phthiocerol/phthiodiolone dimycocerosyl transferase family protein n=1 Tax=Streptomyces sichuanensis TaxID=2871810 RepID=UPI001CE2FFDC|nr:condensation domain-containing protein [Streptomyces sichuanensis]MCA6091851.1 condensation domain-containing protein [Streptomyces sichuanensis]